MPKSFDLSLLNAKGVTKAIEKLIDTVSGAIGRVYTPVDKVLNAHADAKVTQILAKAKIDELLLSERAMTRVAYIEERRQENIDAIVSNSSIALPAEVSNERVDSDWLAAFFENCKDVGNAEMRQIWGRILAGEVAQPGTFARRTLAVVQSMSKIEADLFTRLCVVSFKHSGDEYGFFVPSHEGFNYLRKNYLSAGDETHLKDIGLLSSNFLYTLCPHDVEYGGHKYSIVSKSETESGEPTKAKPSFFPFTHAGNELAAIAGATADREFISLWEKSTHTSSAFYLKLTSAAN